MASPQLDLVDAAAVLQELNSLPPEVNRYDVLASSLQARFAYKLPHSVPYILYVYAGLLAMCGSLCKAGGAYG